MEKFIQEFKDSIKSPDTEERLDLAFYRPLGFIIAKIANLIKVTPSMLSLAGLFSGLWAAHLYFHHHGEFQYFLAASALFLLSGIFDSADGQLARISENSSKLGLILDGICDSLVTISIYIAGAAPLIEVYGGWFALFAFIGALFHSNQCAILDFYHREYAYFGYGKTEEDDYWNPSKIEAQKAIINSKSRTEKIMNTIRGSWIKQQQMLTTRTDEQRFKLKEIINDPNHDLYEKLQKEYRLLNKKMLSVWRLIGTNAHTMMLIGAFYFHRFDLYLLIFDFFLFNFVIFIAGYFQKKQDEKLFKILEII